MLKVMYEKTEIKRNCLFWLNVVTAQIAKIKLRVFLNSFYWPSITEYEIFHIKIALICVHGWSDDGIDVRAR